MEQLHTVFYSTTSVWWECFGGSQNFSLLLSIPLATGALLVYFVFKVFDFIYYSHYHVHDLRPDWWGGSEGAPIGCPGHGDGL